MNYIEVYKKLIKEIKTDAFWVTNCYNIRYLTQFTGTFGHLLLLKEKAVLFTDRRYKVQALQQVPAEVEVVMVSKNFMEEIINWLMEESITTLALEAFDLTHSAYQEIEKKFPHTIIGVNNLLSSYRQIKREDEIEKIRKAASIADQAFEKMLSYIQVGMSEREVAAYLEYQMKCLGSDKPSFDTIVASGVRSSMPHGVASDKLIKRGELVTIDFGATYQGYVSDMTRTIFIGEEIDPEMEALYRAVLSAQIKAVEAVGAGESLKSLDQVARVHLQHLGYGEYFTHGLGHSLGLEVHEPPYVHGNSLEVAEVGMVITIEPGAYLEGRFGVRIEDDVVVTKTGREILNKTSKELIKLKI